MISGFAGKRPRVPTLTKRDLVRHLAVQCNLSLAQADNAFESIICSIMQHLYKKGNCVMLRNFGKFTHVERRERKARNPCTGEQVIVPPYSTIKFKSLLQFIQ